MTTRDRAALSLDELRDETSAITLRMENERIRLRVRDLCARFGVSAKTVRAIPREALPYITIRSLRLYNRADVDAFESRGGEAR